MTVTDQAFAELQAQVAELAAQVGQPSSSSLQPNVLTDINGLIGADFTGHVNAQGLILPAGTGTAPGPTSRIEWTRADGAVVADLDGWESGQDELDITSYNVAGAAAETHLRASGSGGALTTLIVQADNNSNGYVAVSVPHAGVATLLDSLGESSWLRLPVSQARVINFGVGAIAWPGGTTASSVLAINHGLGAVPAGKMAFPTGQANVGPVYVQGVDDLAAPTNATFSVRAQVTSGVNVGSGNTTPIAWLAWI